MTIQELSAEFDILYNNIMSNIAPGLTEYEKSVFLTKAQEQLVIELYSGQYKGESFETSEEIKSYLTNLITTLNISPYLIDTEIPDSFYHYDVRPIEEDILFVILETAVFSRKEPCPCVRQKPVLVKPITHDVYWSVLRNPFKGPNESRVLRLNYSKGNYELISKYELGNYTVKYLTRPTPIILEPLEDITIEGKQEPSNGNLPGILHRTILDRAVQLAKNSWGQSQEQQ